MSGKPLIFLAGDLQSGKSQGNFKLYALFAENQSNPLKGWFMVNYEWIFNLLVFSRESMAATPQTEEMASAA